MLPDNKFYGLQCVQTWFKNDNLKYNEVCLKLAPVGLEKVGSNTQVVKTGWPVANIYSCVEVTDSVIFSTSC